MMRTIILTGLAAVLALTLPPTVAQEAGNEAGNEIVVDLNAVDLPEPGSNAELEKFCGNIVDVIRERRHANQLAELEALKMEVAGQISALEDKRADLELWVKKRDDFASQATGALVQVYASMAPDAAAERLSELDPGLSAAIFSKLKPRNAAAILAEMSAEIAASITTIMAASADKVDGGT